MGFLEYIFPSFEMELLILGHKSDADNAKFLIFT